MDLAKLLYEYASFLQDNNQFIGFTSVEMRKNKLYVAIGVHPEFLNQGYGQEILYLIDELYDYECLYLEVRTWNERARACYEKAGFVKEAYLHDDVYVDGRYRDIVLMGIINQQ